MDAISLFRKNPFLRIVLPYIMGIVLMHTASIRTISALFLAILIITILISKYLKNFINLQGIAASVLLLFFGGCLYNLQSFHHQLPTETQTYLGIVIHPTVKKTKSYQIDCSISSSNKNLSKEKVRLYFFPDTMLTQINIGDSIIFSTQLKEIRNHGNPDEFDYANYMKNMGFLYTGYVGQGNFIIGGNSGKYPIRRAASNVQQRLISHFSKYGIQGDELAILSALTAGNRSMIDDELKAAYSAAGSMHILAVSGLHVGILYMILSFVLSARISNTTYRIFRFTLLLACLWFYAFIAGLTPSVVRACSMFTLLLIGKNIRRTTSSFNILAASAFIILMINPLELFKPGFQFSYLAVLGILYYQPRLESQIPSSAFAPINWLWQLVTVSVAAQVFTFPLALYYFHQFPIYFIITNIFVIPLVWLIILFTISFTFFWSIPAIATLIASILNSLVHLNNTGIEYISNLPGACIQSIQFGPIQLLLSFILLLLVSFYLFTSKYKRLPYSILLYGVIMSMVQIIGYHQQQNEKDIILYHSGNNMVMSIIDGKQHAVITRNIEKIHSDKTIKYLEAFWIRQGIFKNTQWIKTDTLLGIYKGNKNLIVESNPSHFAIQYHNVRLQKIHPNLQYSTNSEINNTLKTCILIDQESGYPDQYKHFTTSNILVLMPDLRTSQVKKWKQLARSTNTPIHEINKQGAFRIKDYYANF